jgi:hypothetical protein
VIIGPELNKLLRRKVLRRRTVRQCFTGGQHPSAHKQLADQFIVGTGLPWHSVVMLSVSECVLDLQNSSGLDEIRPEISLG